MKGIIHFNGSLDHEVQLLRPFFDGISYNSIGINDAIDHENGFLE